MEKDFLRHILIYSGVVVSNVEEQYNQLQQKLRSFFMTNGHEKWFQERHADYSRQIPDLSEKHLYKKYSFPFYWELFTFGLLCAYKDDTAIEKFNSMNIKECYLVQFFDFNTLNDDKPAYLIKGEYDVSMINDADEFEYLKDDIKKEVSIPYWVIDNISNLIGKEIYVFDEVFDWVLVINHECQTFLYRR